MLPVLFAMFLLQQEFAPTLPSTYGDQPHIETIQPETVPFLLRREVLGDAYHCLPSSAPDAVARRLSTEPSLME
jgi:hypothetical protein